MTDTNANSFPMPSSFTAKWFSKGISTLCYQSTIMHFPPYGDIIGSMVVKHINGNLVDVIGGKIFPACVNVHEGKVVRIEHKVSAPPQYILPGLIDSHLHIESSLLTPFRFAEKAVVHGTTAVVVNPHEIANVAGRSGLNFMEQDGKSTPLRFYFTVPSCVPPTRFEGSGAVLGWRDVQDLLSRNEYVALGEVMDYPGVLEDDPEIVAKIEVARTLGKPLDGHCPGLSGYDLDRYIMTGISTDHECTTLHEAEEKHRKGMTIMVREGSGSKDLSVLLPFAIKNKHFLVTDDLAASDLEAGHMNVILRKAVAGGMDPIHAIRAMTLWPAEHYGLAGGSVQLGGAGDLCIVDDLVNFNVLETWIGGEQVAKNGIPVFVGNPGTMPPGKISVRADASALAIKAPGPMAKVRTIEVIPDRITSISSTADLPVTNGDVMTDIDGDVLLIASVNRYKEGQQTAAFVKGFGLKAGAIASSIAHDSHNLIGVGIGPNEVAKAINKVAEQGGGLYAYGPEGEMSLELPIAGLMSDLPAAEIAKKEAMMNAFVHRMGSELPMPFITLSFQSLLLVPELKLGVNGLFDSLHMRYVSIVVR